MRRRLQHRQLQTTTDKLHLHHPLQRYHAQAEEAEEARSGRTFMRCQLDRWRVMGMSVEGM